MSKRGLPTLRNSYEDQIFVEASISIVKEAQTQSQCDQFSIIGSGAIIIRDAVFYWSRGKGSLIHHGDGCNAKVFIADPEYREKAVEVLLNCARHPNCKGCKYEDSSPR
jgi:hypothetical protein